MALVPDPQNIRLGIAGMTPENGHPYSWPAILNGYEPDAMADCGYDAIPQYLGQQAVEAFGIDGVQVTHIWCDDLDQARHVAKASRIANVVDAPENLIGQVDAVLIPTDIGSEHLARARPFVEAGLPVFIDKPLTDRLNHLAAFCDWVDGGRPIMSSSCMRYSQPFVDLRPRLHEVGQPRLITMTMAKDWPRYGIHTLEAIYPLLGPGGFETAQSMPAQPRGSAGPDASSIVHLTHASGCQVVLAVISDMFGGFATMNIHGADGHLTAAFNDPFHAFKTQLADFIAYLRTGQRPFAFDQTIELMLLVIAGLESRAQVGAVIQLADLAKRLSALRHGNELAT